MVSHLTLTSVADISKLLDCGFESFCTFIVYFNWWMTLRATCAWNNFYKIITYGNSIKSSVIYSAVLLTILSEVCKHFHLLKQQEQTPDRNIKHVCRSFLKGVSVRRKGWTLLVQPNGMVKRDNAVVSVPMFSRIEWTSGNWKWQWHAD